MIFQWTPGVKGLSNVAAILLKSKYWRLPYLNLEIFHFFIGFYFKIEQPLRGMELQKKFKKRWEKYRKAVQKEP